MSLARCEPPPAGERYLRFGLYLAWLALVLFLASRHVLWRDEVRAFTIALSGENLWEMLRNLRGEGHPALWYLMLRVAHDIVPAREVLPVVGLLVGAAAMAILVFRSPFRPLAIVLILFSAFALFEYAVLARNYGISMLLLFAVAWLYPRCRDRGIWIGLLLALLCNTNVPAAWLAACFLLFWLVELIGEEGLRWGSKYRVFLLNAAVATVGALICFITIYPPVHDAAPMSHPGGITAAAVAEAIFIPALSFWQLLPPIMPEAILVAVLFGLLLFATLIGLMRAPAALFSALGALIGFELFFRFVYVSHYRHQALFVVYLIVMYWLAARGRGGSWPDTWRIAEPARRLGPIGTACFAALLFAQTLYGVQIVATDLKGHPFGRSRDLAALLQREGLNDAILIAEPDVLLEPLPYYVSNPLYMMRQQRFGAVVPFTRHARVDLTPDGIVAEARALQARYRRPVVIIMQHRLPADEPFEVEEVFVWTFSSTPEQVHRFEAATRKVASFAPAVTDESYDVYVLRPPDGGTARPAGGRAAQPSR